MLDTTILIVVTKMYRIPYVFEEEGTKLNESIYSFTLFGIALFCKYKQRLYVYEHSVVLGSTPAIDSFKDEWIFTSSIRNRNLVKYVSRCAR